MLQDIREAILPVSEALASDAYLRRGSQLFRVKMNPHSSVRPARAGQSGRSYDAKFRIHNDGVTRPMQNDQVSMDGITWWTVWRVLPSALETHAFLECMALPSDIILPVTLTETQDAMGGWTTVEEPDPSGAFPGTVSSPDTQYLLTAQDVGVLNRIAIGYWVEQAPDLKVGDRVLVRDHAHTVMSTSTDDENPSWGRALLSRED